jgi:myo-inositol-1(or 4)-monophosphatase
MRIAHEGRAELFFELSLSPWDYAAGALIVEEAGGVVTDINGNALSFSGKSSVMARNRIVYPTC